MIKLKLTNTRPHALRLSDLEDPAKVNALQGLDGPALIPPNTTASYVFGSKVMRSFESGVIRKYLDLGWSTFEFEVSGPLTESEWTYSDFHTTSGVHINFASINAGSAVESTVPARIVPTHPGIVEMRTSASTNSGCRYYTNLMVPNDRFSARAILALAGVSHTVHFGLVDTVTFGTPTVGRYFTINDLTLTGHVKSPTTAATTSQTLVAGTYYTLDMHLSSTSARFVVSSGGSTILDETLQVAPLTTTTRLSLIAAIAAPGVATPITFVDYLGFGTRPLYI